MIYLGIVLSGGLCLPDNIQIRFVGEPNDLRCGFWEQKAAILYCSEFKLTHLYECVTKGTLVHVAGQKFKTQQLLLLFVKSDQSYDKTPRICWVCTRDKRFMSNSYHMATLYHIMYFDLFDWSFTI